MAGFDEREASNRTKYLQAIDFVHYFKNDGPNFREFIYT
jgi:hypothetical protein